MRQWCPLLFPGLAVLLAALFVGLPSAAAQAEADEPFAGHVVVVRVDDDTLEDSRRFREFRGRLERAAEGGAALVVLHVNAPGNHPREAFQRVIEFLPGLRVPTAAWVDPVANSAGAAAVLACETIVMSPVAALGPAAPPAPVVARDGGDESTGALEQHRRDVATIAAQLRGVANSRNHPPEIASALVDATIELRDAAGEVVKPAGTPLSLAADDAVSAFAGRPALAAGIAREIGEVVRLAGGAEDLVILEDLDAIDRLAAGAGAEVADAGAAGGDEAAVVEAEDGVDEEEDEESVFGRSEERSFAGAVVVIPVGEEDLMAKARFDFMKRMLRKAQADGAAAVVFDMDTPGGYAWYTAELMMQELQRVDIPTFTYVNTRAVSAGSLIAIATDAIYMAPASTIGAAAVVTSGGGELGDTMQDKVNSTIVSVARNVAELKGHNPDLAEAFIDREKEVVIDGVVISEKGKLLSLNASTATEEFGGRPLLAKGIASDLDELLALEGFAAREVVAAEPLGMEAFAHWIQKISVFLILLGIAGAYMEMQTPGFGVPGLVSLLAFGLFFFGNNLAGKLAGYELVILFVLGLVLLVVEIFLLPGTFVFGVAGFGLVLGSLLFAMVDRLDYEAIRRGAEAAPSVVDALGRPALNVALGLCGAAILIGLAMVYLPRTSAMRWMILTASVGAGDAAATSAAAGGSGPPADGGEDLSGDPTPGTEGEAITDLRPEGQVRFGDRIVDAVSEMDFVHSGAMVRVVDRRGSLVVVAPAAKDSGGDDSPFSRRRRGRFA